MSAAHTIAITVSGYEVTRDGHVFSNTNWRGFGRRELIQDLNDDGYPSVRLTVCGKRTRIAVHRLVAMAYLPCRPSERHQVRHLNGNKMDPSAINLAWGTAKENADDRDKHGSTSRGETHSKAVKAGLPKQPWNKGLSGLPASWNKGKKLTEEHRRKISEARKGKSWTEARRDANAK